MPRNRNKSAWVWVTIAAIALTSVARADGTRHGARTGVRAALALLARSQSIPLAAQATGPQLVSGSSERRMAKLLRSSGVGVWVGILPILFIAMVSPLRIHFGAWVRQSGRTPATPLLPSAFQRPPPRTA